MKRLILMRHCKSDWAHDVPDIERPLNTRGRASAQAMGDWLRRNAFIPDTVLCSAATRTYETYEHLRLDTAADMERTLYLADADTMLTVLAGAEGQTVLMIGHNPGLSEFAWRLVKDAPNHPRFGDYPTGATTVIDFDVTDWADVRWEKGTANSFAIPRDVMQAI